MAKSKYLCSRCGVAVGVWGRADGSSYWKHHNGGYGSRSCGKPPRVVEREVFYRQMAELVDEITRPR